MRIIDISRYIPLPWKNSRPPQAHIGWDTGHFQGEPEFTFPGGDHQLQPTLLSVQGKAIGEGDDAFGYFARTLNGAQLIMLDFESVNISVDSLYYQTLYETYKPLAPANMLVGFYGLVTPTYPVLSAARDSWFSVGDYTNPGAYYYSSLFGLTYNAAALVAWKARVAQQIGDALARGGNKPCYPIVAPLDQTTNTFVPREFFYEMLRYVNTFPIAGCFFWTGQYVEWATDAPVPGDENSYPWFPIVRWFTQANPVRTFWPVGYFNDGFWGQNYWAPGGSAAASKAQSFTPPRRRLFEVQAGQTLGGPSGAGTPYTVNNP